MSQSYVHFVLADPAATGDTGTGEHHQEGGKREVKARETSLRASKLSVCLSCAADCNSVLFFHTPLNS